MPLNGTVSKAELGLVTRYRPEKASPVGFFHQSNLHEVIIEETAGGVHSTINHCKF
jgi:hypothetical protein